MARRAGASNPTGRRQTMQAPNFTFFNVCAHEITDFRTRCSPSRSHFVLSAGDQWRLFENRRAATCSIKARQHLNAQLVTSTRAGRRFYGTNSDRRLSIIRRRSIWPLLCGAALPVMQVIIAAC